MVENLLVVAHPDDETLFAGNLLLTRKGTWDLVVATHGDDDRKRHLRRAMNLFEHYGVRWRTCRFLTLPDVVEETEHWDRPLVRDLWWSFLGTPYDMVVTHNRTGDYGHWQHRAVNRAVRDVFSGRRVLEFAPEGDWPSPFVGEFVLTVQQHEDKVRVLDAAYGRECESIERDQPAIMRYATVGPEVFTCEF